MQLRIKTLFFVSMIFMLAACAGQKATSLPLPLAAFTESDVEVSIELARDPNGGYLLSAAFKPRDGFHMYSKDIPAKGVDGLGRPTLLELPAESHMRSLGGLIESVPAEVPNFEPKALLVYPPGTVTLSMPVQLPPGSDWVDDTVKITFMSCSGSGCKAPVVGKLVTVRIPGADILADQ